MIHRMKVISALAVAVLCVTAMTQEAKAQSVHNNVVIVFDDSGSMDERFSGGGTKMEAGKSALKTVIGTMKDDTHIGILLLNGDHRGRWFQELGPVDRKALISKIDAQLRTNGGTPLYRSMKDGMDALLAYRGKHFYGNYRLVVVTDGEETENQSLLPRHLPDMLTRGIQIDVIAVGMAGGHTLQTTAQETSVVTYRSADDPASLTKAIQQVVSETGTTGDAADEDYALVAGLPDDFALKAIQALVSSGNGPIGAIKTVKFDDNGNVAVDEKGQPVTEEAEDGGMPTVLLVLLGIAAIVGFVLFIKANSRSY